MAISLDGKFKLGAKAIKNANFKSNAETNFYSGQDVIVRVDNEIFKQARHGFNLFSYGMGEVDGLRYMLRGSIKSVVRGKDSCECCAGKQVVELISVTLAVVKSDLEFTGLLKSGKTSFEI